MSTKTNTAAADYEQYCAAKATIAARRKLIYKLGDKGKMFNVTFKKKDGTLRKMQCRLSQFVKIGKKPQSVDSVTPESYQKSTLHAEYVTVLDLDEYRLQINLQAFDSPNATGRGSTSGESLESDDVINIYNAARASFRQINVLTITRLAGGGKVYNV